METGVYFISSPSGKKYIGSTSESFYKRWRTHKYHLRKKNHRNRILQAAWDKYGEENMIFAVYLRCEPDKCLALEQIAIDEFRPEYNIALSASAPMQGRKHTASAIEKCRVSKLGTKKPPFTAEHRRKLGDATRGKKRPPFTAEHLENMRISQTGKTLTAEHKQKISDSGKGLKRHPVSDTHRHRLSVSRMGRFTGAENSSARAVLCVETGAVYVTMVSAQAWLRETVRPTATASNISSCCAGKLKSAYGYTWCYADQPQTVDNPAAPH